MYENIKNREKLEEIRGKIDNEAVARPEKAAVSEEDDFVLEQYRAGAIHKDPAAVEYDPYQGTYAMLEHADKKARGLALPKRLHIEHFENTLAQDIFHQLEKDEGRLLQLSRGVREKVAVIFADIRGFTYLCTMLPPDRAFRLLNIFHSEMIKVIRDEHGGYVDKLIGDCIMAYFGIPYATDCSDRAVKCAVSMQERIPAINATMDQYGFPPIEIGIGINTGVVHAGFVTTDRNISGFTVIGEAVNVAAKLENVAGPSEIVVGETTRNEILDIFAAQELSEQVTVTGTEGEVKTFKGFKIIRETQSGTM